MKLTRITILPKDIMTITGRSERGARDLARKIKSHFNKQDHQYLTVREFCQYTGISSEEIARLLKS